jgi:hypothetical protein
VLANGWIVAGPVTMNRTGQFAYHKFYTHSPERALNDNMQRFGRRPLGICSASHNSDFRAGRPEVRRPVPPARAGEAGNR